MKPLAKPILLTLSCTFFLVARLSAQTFENAGQYIEYINKARIALSEKYLTYLSAVSHGKSARKVEKRRQEVLTAINDTRYSIMGMPPYKGDRSLKDTTIAYLKLLNYVFNEQYGKIVNMEEIAEQSYDAMEAYLLAQEKADEKLQEASKTQTDTEKVFATKNNITLVNSESELETKMKVASDVMKHTHEVYLVFFKCYKQEAYLMDAISRKNLVSIEQNINSLQKFAEEGKEKLKGMQGYSGDPSLIRACEDVMNFYEMETGKGPGISDFFLKQESFEKLKKQFDSKPKSQRTQQDVDQFNNGVNEANAAIQEFNKTMNELNKARAAALNGWDKAYKKFMDTYMPVQR